MLASKRSASVFEKNSGNYELAKPTYLQNADTFSVTGQIMSFIYLPGTFGFLDGVANMMLGLCVTNTSLLLDSSALTPLNMRSPKHSDTYCSTSTLCQVGSSTYHPKNMSSLKRSNMY